MARVIGMVPAALPPTALIEDPRVRTWADAFQAVWDQRVGLTDPNGPHRFITAGEFNTLANNAILQAFQSVPIGKTGGGAGGNPTMHEINRAIDNIADWIRQGILYQMLEQGVSPIELDRLRREIDAVIKEGSAVISRLEIVENASETSALQIGGLASRMGIAEGAIISEQSTRATKDNALASAINTIWSSIGGSTAVIQDGQLASVSPNAASAVKWNQVVASVTDPNTGQVNSTSIKQELNSYANSANSTFNSIYTVRAQVAVGGQTLVGGFGLSATAGAGSGQGPLIDFGVRGDRFWIGATADTPSAATQLGESNSIPFIVLTSSQVVNGVVHPPGVYMKRSVIGFATIGEAQIADAAITNAKIGNVIQSANYSPGSAGWTINKSGSAEFNGVVLSRPNRVASGVYDANKQLSTRITWVEEGVKGMETHSRLVTLDDVIGTIVIDTGYNSPDVIAALNGPGYVARVQCIGSNSPGGVSWGMGYSGGLPPSPMFQVAPEATVGFMSEFGSVGATWFGEGGRAFVLVNIRINPLHANITWVRVRTIRWELLRVT